MVLRLKKPFAAMIVSVIILCAGVASAAEHQPVPTSIHCRSVLAPDEEATLLRQEIAYADKAYAARFPLGYVSSLRGSELSQLPHYSARNGHMIYLASGADVWRPLYDFPLIRHFHLVDVLAGWGDSPLVCIEEIENRLRSLHPTAQIQVVDLGFRKVVNDSILSQSYTGLAAHRFISDILTQPGASAPMIFSVTWESAVIGRQQKIFYLHPVDMHDESIMRQLLESIPQAEPLVGILEAGWGSGPARPVFDQLMSRLDERGFFIFESMETIGFDEGATIKKVEEQFSGSYEVKLSLPDPSLQEEMASSDLLKQRRIFFEYLISRKRGDFRHPVTDQP